VSEREERIGLNEAVFREVNERIEGLAETFQIQSQPLDLICECGDASCVDRIRMTRQEYEQVRADPRLFAVYPGHDDAGVDEVVERREGYDVVIKNEGEPQRVAEQTDPRS
jgi:hypothetical protein